VNWLYIEKILPLFGKAALVTLDLAIKGILFSLAIGLVGSLILHFALPVLASIVRAYVEVARNTPLLVQLFFLYFGLPQVGIHWSGATCGAIGLSFLGGSYMIEAFRGGIEAVSAAQVESAASIGLSRFQSFRYVIAPQALSIATPALAANAIFLLKETSICGAIAIPDLVHTANDQIGMYYRTYECLLLLTASYLVLILPLSLFSTFVERRLRHAQFGA
jgi:polar amino acid transport system permease protein